MIDKLYASQVDHLVNSMKRNSPVQDVTNSKKDWDDFWYNSKESDAPFDTQAYANYKALVDKQREQINKDGLIESLYKLGYKIDTLLGKIISQLDTLIEEDSEDENDIIEEDNYPDNGILEDGQLPEESYNKEFEITVDPLTHKVIYNAELNEYKVVKREDIK